MLTLNGTSNADLCAVYLDRLFNATYCQSQFLNDTCFTNHDQPPLDGQPFLVNIRIPEFFNCLNWTQESINLKNLFLSFKQFFMNLIDSELSVLSSVDVCLLKFYLNLFKFCNAGFFQLLRHGLRPKHNEQQLARRISSSRPPDLLLDVGWSCPAADYG